MLNEPLRDRAPEVPLMAVRARRPARGRTRRRVRGLARGRHRLEDLEPDANARAARCAGCPPGGTGTAYDWLGGRALDCHWASADSGSWALRETRLDDQFLPQRQSRGRQDVLGRSFGWRNDNHVLGWAKLAPIANPQSVSLEVMGSRVVSQPYDPMISWNDTVMTYTVQVSACDLCPPVSTASIAFYRASDHQPMTETRRMVATLQTSRLGTRMQWHFATSWQHGSELTSPGLTRDPRNLFDHREGAVRAGPGPATRPVPRLLGRVALLQAHAIGPLAGGVLDGLSASRRTAASNSAAACSTTTRSRTNCDSVLPTSTFVDSLRTWHTHAPGGWAYVQHRGEHEGLVWNTGLRLQMFSAGDATAPQGVSSSTFQQLPHAEGSGAIWTLSPRIGLAMPLTVRDAFSASYARIHQAPGRDYLSDDRLLIYSRRPLGSPTLEPEELITYQVGLKHLFDARWSLQMSVFHRDLYSQIGIVNDPYFTGTFRPRYANSEYGHATGFEVALLAGSRPGATPAKGAQSTLKRFLSGEFSVRYTQMDAYGTISGPDGWYYGAPFGFRPLAIGEHPLDWDRGPMFSFDAVWREPHVFTFAWVTQLAGGARWTPTNDTLTATGGPPGTSPNLSAVNSRQLAGTRAHRHLLARGTAAVARRTPAARRAQLVRLARRRVRERRGIPEPGHQHDAR